MSRSFRPEFATRPPGYRTPSPPRAAVEPLSPISGLKSSFASPKPLNGFRKRKYEHYYQDASRAIKAAPEADSRPSSSAYTNSAIKAQSPSALDVFAAVATSPSLAADVKSPAAFHSPTVAVFPSGHTPLAEPPHERSAKRSRSEVFGHLPISLNDDRPSTSHILPPVPPNATSMKPYAHLNGSSREHSSLPHSGILEQDAELLLMFARGSHNQHGQQMPDSSRSKFAAVEGRADSSRSTNHQHIASDLEIPPLNTQRSRESKPLLPLLRQDSEQLLSRDHPPQSMAVGSSTAYRHVALDSMGYMDLQPQDQLAYDQPKAREHRGWPKGKPRGPRAPGFGRKKRNEAGPKREAKATGGGGSGDKRTGRQSRGAGDFEEEILAADVFRVPAETRRPRRNSLHAIPPASPIRPRPASAVKRSPSATPSLYSGLLRASKLSALLGTKGRGRKARDLPSEIDFCKLCTADSSSSSDSRQFWIMCDGCKAWIHTGCAGFKSQDEAQEVNKYHCTSCKEKHGPNTYVRKSSRAHASVDYVGLNEGKVRTAEDVVGHHYIDPIKQGTLQFQPESFPRMPPELVTAEYFAKTGGWTEPILIPAALNPRPLDPTNPVDREVPPESSKPDACTGVSDYFFTDKYLYDCVPDDGQDKLGMVIPHGLTVRRVADLHGPEEKLDVIDVKLQEGEDRRWSLGQWADYYEAEGAKPVRNVISLEVSRSTLGRLIRRPKVVRDLDLQDSVWPGDETAKGSFPRVQFYCLMSVADCYTDFHIDFGGSSVYYHILKGRKTFFFIPPKPKYLKKYEDWCNSPDQNSVFLGNETKECYRVDLYPGDTMLIPSGWIHAVWTPENSLVIGGNFLTRLHYGNQIMVNEIEKATNVVPRFRYPFFQRILWLTLIRYLETDPVPSTVVEKLCAGGIFERREPIWYQGLVEADEADVDSPELSNARFYPEAEVQGLSDLIRFIHRTVLISQGKLPTVSKKSQEAVTRSIPKGYGDPAEILKTFAMWAAWKRGNETLPPWAYPLAQLTELEPIVADKKTLAAVQRKIDRQALHEAQKGPGGRSLRKSTENAAVPGVETAHTKIEDTSNPSPSEHRRAACDECRRRRRRCTHNGAPTESLVESPEAITPRFGIKSAHSPAAQASTQTEPVAPETCIIKAEPERSEPVQDTPILQIGTSTLHNASDATGPVASTMQDPTIDDLGEASDFSPRPNTSSLNQQDLFASVAQVLTKKPKIRACAECKKSKRRCIHDEHGQVDPVKQLESPLPRGASAAKRAKSGEAGSRPGSSKKTKAETLEPAGVDAMSVLAIGDEETTPYSGVEAGSAPMLNGFSTDGTTAVRAVTYDQDTRRSEVSSGADRKDRSRSRTSSSNQHMSSSDSAKATHSTAPSPLTEPDIIPPYVYGDATPGELASMVPNGTLEGQTPRDKTPRQRKQVERYTDASAMDLGTRANQRRTPTKSSSPKTGASAKRATPRAGSMEGNSQARGSPSKHTSKSPGLSKGPGTEMVEEDEEEEDESLKLARMLASQEHGLRRRG